MLTRTAQIFTHASFFNDWLKFKNNLGNIENVQRHILEQTLKSHPFLKSKKDFHDQPIRDYQGLSDLLKNSHQPDVRFQPTSGTGDKEKLIPYNDLIINQFNRALNPWLFDMAKTHPSILLGKHYWSISWLPTHWRKKGWRLDDFELFPGWKKSLIRNLLAVPNEVSHAPTLSSTQFATLAWLVGSPDLTLFSVWSPTFLLQLLDLMNEWKEALAQTLVTGKWGAFEKELQFLTPPKHPRQAQLLLHGNYSTLWPNLKLISCWSSSSSAQWAKKLCSLFPNVEFQGKGLWATEGVISIPFENKFVLSYLSHYYEFMEIKSGSLMAAHQLKEGMEVYPVITCGNGFTRYQIKDRIVVDGFMKKTPLLQFMERDDTFDMVGEKVDTQTLLLLHGQLKEAFPRLTWVTTFVINEKFQRPYYCFVLEGENTSDDVLGFISHFLDQHFHYHLAKELGQLGPEKIVIGKNSFARYEHYQIDRGMVQGNIKVELATKITSPSDFELFLRYFACETFAHPHTIL
jgi:hypothetical protein